MPMIRCGSCKFLQPVPKELEARVLKALQATFITECGVCVKQDAVMRRTHIACDHREEASA